MNYPKRPGFAGENELATKSVLKNFGVTEFSAQYDYVMVFKMVDGSNGPEQSPAAKTCLNAMLTAGLEIFPYLSVQKDELYVLFRSPLAKLKDFADNEDYLMRVDEIYLENLLKTGDAEAKIAPIDINDDRSITPYSPYQHIFLEFRTSKDNGLYAVPPGEDNPFIKSVRLKLVMAMLRAPKRAGGCDLEISKLLYRKEILALYPLHERSITKQLARKCFSWCNMPWDAPTHDLKEYFGEKIALYTVFIGHYSVYLIVPSIVGLAFQLVVWGTGDFSHPVLPFYSLLITVWSIVMIEYWKRQEATTAMHWGMSNFEKQEQDRPEYHGELVRSHINGEEIVYFPERKAARLQFFSQTIVTTFIMIVVGVVTGIYILRFSLQQSAETNPYASTVASILNAVQIQFFNLVYQKIVILLTNNENHRTDTMYEDSMIIKLFSFQFINSYASFFFLGFIATYLPRPAGATEDMVGQCAATNCMEPIAINLAIIFGTRLFLTNFLDVFLPYLSYRGKLKEETKGVAEDVKLTPAEKDYLLVQYNPMLESISAYADTAIQYGYTMLFITALPIATFLSLVNNWARIKFYTYKLFKFYQRPVPTGAQDIGTWLSIFQFLSIAAVVTNAALICFTMDVLWDIFDLTGRVWIFIGFQWVLISLQFLATEVIDDVPLEVNIQMERNEFINLKVIEKVADEDFGVVHNKDEEDMVEEGKTKRGPIHCGNLCGCRCKPAREHLKTVKSRRLRNDLGDFSVFEYPEQASASGAWPKPLAKAREGGAPELSIREQKAAAKAAAKANSTYDTSSYLGAVSAVAAPSSGVAGYSAVPPPPPNAGYV